MKQKKIFSISRKLTFLLAALILIPIALSGTISHRYASNAVEREIRNTATTSITGIKDNLNTFMLMQEENISVLSHNSNIVNLFEKKPEDMVYVYDALKGFKEGHKDILSVYIGRKDKVINLYPDVKLPDDFDPTTRSWYKEAVSKNKIIWSDPYKDAATNMQVVTVAIPVYDSKKELVGVLGADISLDQLTKIVGNSKIGSEGYLALLDGKGNLIAHPDKTLLGKELPVEDLKKAVYGDVKGNIDFNYMNDRKTAYFSTIDSTGWKVVGIFENNEITDKIKIIMISNIISGVIIVIIAIILGLLFSRPIVKSIKILTADMIQIGDGDLTVRSNVKSKDEIGILSDTLNLMADELGTLMRKIKGLSMEVSTSADSLAASSEETTASTEEVSRTVVEISNATEEQANSTENGLMKTNELAENLQRISDSIRNMSEMVKYSYDLSQRGLKTMEVLMEKNKENSSAAVQISQVISEVDHSSEEVGAISSTISGIAAQTNLLALNASIEAARAGEQGKGFSVVAEEIRKLAEQSSEAANNIQALIKEIQSKSQNAVATMDIVKPIVIAQDEAVTATSAIFNDISRTIDKLKEEANSIAEMNEDMVKSKNDILEVMESISASAEETSASTQQVAASTQEQLASMEEVARTAEQLNSLAHSLSAGIDKFKM